MSWVSKITFGPQRRGPLTGICGFHIEFTKDKPTDLEVAQVLLAIRRSPYASYKLARVHGEFGERNEANMLQLLKSLTDHGFAVSAEVKDGSYHPWFNLCARKSVQVGLEPWAAFRCEELRYQMESASDPAPETPPPAENGVPASLFVIPGPKVRNPGLFKFFEREAAKGNFWHLLVTAEKAPHESVYEPETSEGN